MADGEIKACWIICTNPVATVANRRTVIEGLERAELVITQDTFAETETNGYADVVLPAALWAEADGVMINSERTLTLCRQAVDPVGQALPDWRIIADVACAMGFADAFTYASSGEVFDEIKRFWNPRTGYDLRGIDYDRLRSAPVQWPCPPEAAEDRHPIRYLNDGVSQTLLKGPDGGRPRLVFATPNGRAVFYPRPHVDAAEMPDDDFPFVLNTGRLQHQWHTMTKTGKVAKLNKLNPGPFVEINPDDADRLGLSDGDSLVLGSRRGRSILPTVVTDRVRPGNLFAPFHWNDMFGESLSVNAITNDAVDPISFQPEFKICAVSVTKVPPPRSVPTVPAATQRAEELFVASDSGVQVEILAGLLGVQPPTRPTFDAEEQHYLSGYLTGLGCAEARPMAAVPTLPERAPLAPERRHWVDGLLAGLYSRVAIPDGDTHQEDRAGAPAVTPTEPVLILWASQTGTAHGFATTVRDRLQAEGYDTRLLEMSEFDTDALASTQRLLVITSTFGDGDHPDNGSAPMADALRLKPAGPRRPQLRSAGVRRLGVRQFLRVRPGPGCASD